MFIYFIYSTVYLLSQTTNLSFSTPSSFGTHKFIFYVCFCFVNTNVRLYFFLDSTYKW